MQGTEGHGVERPGPARPPRRAVTPPRTPVAAPVERGAMAVAIGCALPDGVEGAALQTPETLDAALLARLGVDRVFCPLFAAEFDALAVAARLATMGFDGRLVVLCPTLPNPRMVAREIRHHAAGMMVELRLVQG